MKSSDLTRLPLQLYQRMLFAIQIWLFKKITQSSNAWLVFDKAGLPGFGTKLLRLYFPVYYAEDSHRDSFSLIVKQKISNLLSAHTTPDPFEEKIITAITGVLRFPIKEQDLGTPYLDNHYFGVFDAAVLSVMMETFKPGKILEIGSGLSTRYMKSFRDQLDLQTELICIDPAPRVEIRSSIDKLILKPLEEAIDEGSFALEKGDFVFMDGSHYIFQGNDTLTFFFKLLPSLPSGVIIHIHDIYLPFDYPQNVAQQLWTEQYILAAMIESGLTNYQVLYPAYYKSKTSPKIAAALAKVNDQLTDQNFEIIKTHDAGFSFWMIKK